MTLKERAEVIDEMIADGFCTHYQGYTCDRDWSDPAVCKKCIASWIIRQGITERSFYQCHKNSA